MFEFDFDVASLKQIPSIVSCIDVKNASSDFNRIFAKNKPKYFVIILEKSENIPQVAEAITNGLGQYTVLENPSTTYKMLLVYKKDTFELMAKFSLIEEQSISKLQDFETSDLVEIFSNRDKGAAAEVISALKNELNAQNKRRNSAENIVSIFYEIMINFEHASFLYFYGKAYGNSRVFNHAVSLGIQLFDILKNPTYNPDFQLELMGNIKNDLERMFMQGLFTEPAEIYFNHYKRKFLDFLEWMADEFTELHPEIEPKIMEYMNNMNIVYERDYLWNMRPILGSKTLFRGPDPSMYNEDDRVLNWFKKMSITETIDFRGESEAAKAEKFRKFLGKKGINATVVSLNERGNEDENLYGYVKKLIHQVDDLMISFRIIINNKNCTYVHCHTGKDRTGVFAALMMKLYGRSNEEIIDEYCRTGLDSQVYRIQHVIDYLDKTYPNIEDYFKNIGLTESEIAELKKR